MLPVGKLNYRLLEQLLCDAPTDERTVVGPRIGEDAAAIDFGDRLLIVATDPITFATDLIGWYAVQVNANDVACMGAEPKWFLADILLPENQTDEDLARILFGQIKDACQQLGISWIGGHSEVTAELSRPLVVGTMLGEVPKDRLVTSAGAQLGDCLLLTKGFPIEGTALIAREKEKELRSQGLDTKKIERAKEFLFRPGISTVKDALTASRAGKVNALHDPTEGGIANGLWELAMASSAQILVDEEALTPVPEGEILCKTFGLDPRGTIASGALLICAPESDAATILQALHREGIAAWQIGKVIGKGDPKVLLKAENGQTRLLPLFERDEVARLFEGTSG
ncbi:MAG: AIR synthase family protein [Armatimonadetes bacterium]|nr:AIR synthase family protein [Armatimonadota bacterium]MDW8121395.1 AIR synthase family protein [Armatimonadota bacterium]